MIYGTFLDEGILQGLGSRLYGCRFGVWAFTRCRAPEPYERNSFETYGGP